MQHAYHVSSCLSVHHMYHMHPLRATHPASCLCSICVQHMLIAMVALVYKDTILILYPSTVMYYILAPGAGSKHPCYHSRTFTHSMCFSWRIHVILRAPSTRWVLLHRCYIAITSLLHAIKSDPPLPMMTMEPLLHQTLPFSCYYMRRLLLLGTTNHYH